MSGRRVRSDGRGGHAPRARERALPAPTRPVRFHPNGFAASTGKKLRAALVAAHEREPFSPARVRDGARRVAAIAGDLHLRAVLVRGSLDVGGAELDHVWVMVDERVVDPALPLFAVDFVESLRAYVAGDVGDEDIEHAAEAYPIDYRVVGLFPETLRYLGMPVWGARGRTGADAT